MQNSDPAKYHLAHEITILLEMSMWQCRQPLLLLTHSDWHQGARCSSTYTSCSSNPMLSRISDSVACCRSGSQGSKFSRLEADVAAMQRNSATYCEQPAASPEYDAWLADFSLNSRADEIAAICQENAFMSELQVWPDQLNIQN